MPRTIIACRFSDASLATAPQIAWAVSELERRLRDRDIGLVRADDAFQSHAQLVLTLAGDPSAQDAASRTGIHLPTTPEALAVFAESAGGVRTVLAVGADTRGLVYAITELADRVRYADDPLAVFDMQPPLVETPTAKVRSISRCFQSVDEDLVWYHDRDGWRDYLTHLATNRFNRVALTIGMQYNYPYGNEFLSDVYFHFAYPFLVSVPGHDVRAVGLPDAERERNLETLKFIAREAHRRGLDFTLALWTQYYDFDDCPYANYCIEGIGEANRAAYCRDALALLLAEVPEITGLTLRIHVECGIPEGSYDFWQGYFDAVKTCGRTVRLDLHAKGIDAKLVDLALATGMPVSISPKYTSEHMGLPYHQASIRALERGGNASADATGVGRDMETLYSGPDAEKYANAWRFSEGARKFMRYSYGDLLTDERPYDIVYRIWPGTMRVLLWGDPVLAGGYGRNALLAGSSGIELCEPLSFKGRMGTGIAGNRTGYADDALVCARDWEKFDYTYRVWGRRLYNPDCDPESWRGYLRATFGEAAQSCETALSAASRILPLITLAHTPTSSNNSYWPEIYENMSVVHEAPRLPYGYELYKPARFGTVGACDPQLFMSPAEFADALFSGEPIRRIAPLTWANGLDDLAQTAEHANDDARALADTGDPAFRRWSVDVAIHAAIGRFFAAKIRAAVCWELYLLSGEADTARAALDHYVEARAAWAVAADESRDIYLPDLTYGPHSWLRGCWSDRLPVIDRDIADMRELIGRIPPASSAGDAANLQRIHGWSGAQRMECRHTPPSSFTRGSEVALSFASAGRPMSAYLHYRRLNQSEPWQSVELRRARDAFAAAIPGSYTASPYALQYYVEFCDGACSSFWPGLADDLCNQPYVVLESAPGETMHVSS